MDKLMSAGKRKTLEAKAAMRWYWPHGVNGPKVLQQAWMCIEDGSVEWQDVPNNIPEPNWNKHPETEQQKNGRLRAEIDALPLNTHPSQNTVPCGTCGKPMEDRGAENQWCKECVDSRTKTSEDK